MNFRTYTGRHSDTDRQIYARARTTYTHTHLHLYRHIQEHTRAHARTHTHARAKERERERDTLWCKGDNLITDIIGLVTVLGQNNYGLNKPVRRLDLFQLTPEAASRVIT